MELIADNGYVVSIPSGCKRKVGRGPELAIFDKTVSRDQVLLEYKGHSKKSRSADYESPSYQLLIKVLGSNPVCVVHSGQPRGCNHDCPEVVFLKKGEDDTMAPGDKISLSLSHPQFFTAREEGGKDSVSWSNVDRSGNFAEDDLLQKWNDRRNIKVAGPSTSHAGPCPADASKNITLGKDEDIAANEEVGIARAVARRQKRALERQQLQEQKVQDAQAKEAENMYALQHDGHKLGDKLIDFPNIDPVKEFGFLVEGSEFDQYKKSNKGRWIWPVPSNNIGSSSDDDDDTEDRRTPKHVQKAKQEEDDEWRGDDQQEEATVTRSRDRKLGAKLNLRSNAPSSSENRDIPVKAKKHGGRINKSQKENLEEDDNEADETLGGFIVNDEEDLIEDADASDSTEELSEDDEIEEDDEEDEEEEDEEDSDSEELPKETRKKTGKKPLCKYGKNCYRKNADHLTQFRHQ